ncbi:MAG: 50S ribosomal protein L13 [Chloroflexi bacterium]|nr:50S ribosomal protein L13 [Chloroflexota bacterium]
MKTFTPKSSDIRSRWHVLDAANQVLGRIATQAAVLLKGKHKPIYTPNLDTGDFVIVVNAEKVRVTGNKLDGKVYYRHTQYPGGLRAITLGRLMETHPTRAIERAVKGMLPHNTLGRQLFRKLKVYAGPGHPHQAQVHAGEGKRSQESARAVEKESRPAPETPKKRQRKTAVVPETPATAAVARPKPRPKRAVAPKPKPSPARQPRAKREG